eukprot:COSAG04_NODE_22855_length_348_cov_0.730924_1_plen_53_part_01
MVHVSRRYVAGCARVFPHNSRLELIARKDVVAIVGHCCNKRGGIWFNIERAIK